MRSLYFFPIMLIAAALGDELFVTPASWQGTNITLSTTDRASTINAAIEEVLSNTTASPSVDFYSILAIYDMYTNATSYKEIVTTYFLESTFSTDELNQGVNAMRAYQVYQDLSMLNIAIQAWYYGRNLTISEEDVSAGSIITKSFKISKTCSGVTLVGGTFWQTTENEPTIFGDSTALFFTLSAYLYKATLNETYLSAAQDSGGFMVDIMNITGSNNGLATISANVSASCGDTFGSGDFRIDQAGFFLEGLAVLPGDVSFGKQNLSVDTLRSDLVNITLTTNVLSDAASGIINIGKGVGDQNLVQGLGTLYHAISTSGSAELATYIGNFLSIQFNTIITSATADNTNIYTGSWIGPPETQYNPTNQTLAIFALVNGAQVFANETNSTGSDTNGTGVSSSNGTTGNPANHSKTRIGAIVGGVIGGLALLAVIGIVTLSLITRRRRRFIQTRNMDSTFDIDPSESQAQMVTHDLEFFSRPQNINTNSPTIHALSPVRSPRNAGYTGLQDRKSPTMHVSNQGPSEVSTPTSAPISYDPPSSTGSSQLQRIPIDDLVQLLQIRLQQEGRVSQGAAPPAYEAH